MLGLTVDSIGPAPAVLGLDAGAVRLGAPGRRVAGRARAADGPGRTRTASCSTASTAPRRCRGGARGAWVLPGVPAGEARRVRIGGTIRVAGPVPAGTVAFEVTAPLTWS